MHLTIVEDGGLLCHRFGKITAIDCSCLRNLECGDCFIFKSLKESNLDSQKINLEEILFDQAISLDIN